MRKFSRERNQKALINTKTNALKVDFPIENQPPDLDSAQGKQELRKLSSKINEESLAFEGTADCFKSKLHAIWDKAIEFILKSEDEYTHKLLESLIEIDGFYINAKTPRISEFALSLDESEIDKIKDIRSRYYFLTLKSICRINYIYNAFYEGNGILLSPFDNTFKECLFDDENFKSGKFINLIAQEFFSLSINAYELGKVCGLKIRVPLSKELRYYRSAEGWKKQMVLKNVNIIRTSQGLNAEAIEALDELEDTFDPYGEEVLVDRIKKIIPKLNPESNCKSVLAVINDNEKLFKNLLDEYIEGIGSPIVKNGRRLTYKPNLDKPGLAILIKKRKLFTDIKAQIKSSSKADRPNKSS